jgi:hypothetical protein
MNRLSLTGEFQPIPSLGFNRYCIFRMYLIITASLALVPFLLGVPGRAAPTGEVATISEGLATDPSSYDEITDLSKRQPGEQQRREEKAQFVHVPPPHFEREHRAHEKREAESESNVKLQPRKRWGYGSGGGPGCCGNNWGGRGCCGQRW